MTTSAEVRFTMPVSPSTNNLFVERRDGKGRAKTSVYKRWLESAGWHVKLQYPRAVPGRVRVEVFAPFDRHRDLDNIKPALDLLVMLGLIDDDCWIDDLRIVRLPPGPLMTIAIRPMDKEVCDGSGKTQDSIGGTEMSLSRQSRGD